MNAEESNTPPAEGTTEDNKVVDFREYRKRPDVFQKRVRRMEARLGPETEAKIPGLYQAILDDPRAKEILGKDAE